MTGLLNHEQLVTSINDITQALYGAHVSYGGACSSNPLDTNACSIMVVILIGMPMYNITVSVANDVAPLLANAMYGCEIEEVNAERVHDALHELTSLIAKLIALQIAPDHDIGQTAMVSDDSSFHDLCNLSGLRLQFGSHLAVVDVVIGELNGF